MPRNLQGTVLAGAVHKGHEDSIATALQREAHGALTGMTLEEEPELTVVFNIRDGEFAEKWIPLEVDYQLTGKADLMAVADAPADKEGWINTTKMNELRYLITHAEHAERDCRLPLVPAKWGDASLPG
jgi:hypothetical protein